MSSGAHERLVSSYDPDQARPLLPQPFVVLVTVLTSPPRFASPLWEVPVCCERGPAKVMPKAPPLPRRHWAAPRGLQGPSPGRGHGLAVHSPPGVDLCAPSSPPPHFPSASLSAGACLWVLWSGSRPFSFPPCLLSWFSACCVPVEGSCLSLHPEDFELGDRVWSGGSTGLGP